jgi:hypothetical protein
MTHLDTSNLATTLAAKPAQKRVNRSYRKLSLFSGLAVMVTGELESELKRRYLIETLNGKLFPARGKSQVIADLLPSLDRIETTGSFMRFDLARANMLIA